MYEQREIVLVPFPYSDLSSVKKRPVLIVSNNIYNNRFKDVIVVVITSSKTSEPDLYSTLLSDKNLEYGILPEKSLIKAHKIFTIDKSRIIRKFSKITDMKFSEVQDILNTLFRR